MTTSHDELFINTLRDQIVAVLTDDDTELYIESSSNCNCCPTEYGSLGEHNAEPIADKVITKFLSKMKIF